MSDPNNTSNERIHILEDIKIGDWFHLEMLSSKQVRIRIGDRKFLVFRHYTGEVELTEITIEGGK